MEHNYVECKLKFTSGSNLPSYGLFSHINLKATYWNAGMALFGGDSPC